MTTSIVSLSITNQNHGRIETMERARERRRNSIRKPGHADAMEVYDEAAEKFRRLAAQLPEGS